MFICFFRLSQGKHDLSVWLARDSRPGQTLQLLVTGPGSSGPASLLDLWSRAETTTSTAAAATTTAAVAASRETSLGPEVSTWLATAAVVSVACSPATTADWQGAAVGVEENNTLWLSPAPAPKPTATAAAIKSAVAAAAGGPINLMANWSWQPKSHSSLDLAVAGLSLANQTSPLHQEWLARPYTGGSGWATETAPLPPLKRCSSRYNSGSEGSEIMILDAPDENIDFPEDYDV